MSFKNIKYLKPIIFNLLMGGIAGPFVIALAMFNNNKFKGWSYLEYVVFLYTKVPLFFIVVILGGTIISILIDKKLRAGKAQND